MGKNSRKMTVGTRLLMVFILIVGMVFLPVSTVLAVGMMPTIVAYFTDQTRAKTRVATIGFLNFASCFPLVLPIAFDVRTMDAAYDVLGDPMNIIIMFTGALAGYFLDWTITGINNVVMAGRARARLDMIDKRRAELVRKWGEEVTGKIPLDDDGFPLMPEESEK